jgi:hypothetical protein
MCARAYWVAGYGVADSLESFEVILEIEHNKDHREVMQ